MNSIFFCIVFCKEGNVIENKYNIREMTVPDISDAVGVWAEQYKLYCADNEFPDYWRKNTKDIAAFLKNKVEKDTAFIIAADDRIIGYLAYDEFPFHGEKSVFCPSAAHAVLEEYKEAAYPVLYQIASQRWASKNIFNHMWTINYNDAKLRSILYDLGFGSYLIDAFANTNSEITSRSMFKIERAEEKDKHVLYDLVEKSREYYSSAPLFLRRDEYKVEDIIEVIRNGNVFIAWDGPAAVGFINVSISQENNVIEMYTKSYGLIDELGVYIKPAYRGKGLGTELLRCIFDFCRSNGLEGIHVDFETANLFANKFWRKYFKPMLLSVRRTINKDIND